MTDTTTAAATNRLAAVCAWGRLLAAYERMAVLAGGTARDVADKLCRVGLYGANVRAQYQHAAAGWARRADRIDHDAAAAAARRILELVKAAELAAGTFTVAEAMQAIHGYHAERRCPATLSPADVEPACPGCGEPLALLAEGRTNHESECPHGASAPECIAHGHVYEGNEFPGDCWCDGYPEYHDSMMCYHMPPHSRRRWCIRPGCGHVQLEIDQAN